MRTLKVPGIINRSSETAAGWGKCGWLESTDEVPQHDSCVSKLRGRISKRETYLEFYWVQNIFKYCRSLTCSLRFSTDKTTISCPRSAFVLWTWSWEPLKSGISTCGFAICAAQVAWPGLQGAEHPSPSSSALLHSVLSTYLSSLNFCFVSGKPQSWANCPFLLSLSTRSLPGIELVTTPYS